MRRTIDPAYDLMPAEIQADLPALYTTEKSRDKDPLCRLKLFTPDANWTWYAIEYDPTERLCWGLVVGMETELGYFSLEELECVHGPLGMPIERDLYFEPTRLSALRGW